MKVLENIKELGTSPSPISKTKKLFLFKKSYYLVLMFYLIWKLILLQNKKMISYYMVDKSFQGFINSKEFWSFKFEKWLETIFPLFERLRGMFGIIRPSHLCFKRQIFETAVFLRYTQMWSN